MRLGPYTLAQELGRGASGVVYQGHSPEGRAVAVKVLTTQSPETLERFQREARLHERLGEEAGFVPIIDLGLAENRPYLVMPLLTGGTLRDRLRRGPLTVEEALELGQRLAAALGRAHALGIVHRDVKPENILFAGGRPFLADLGLAKHFRHDVTGASQSVVLSRGGEARGTVSYMAPEQLSDASSAGPPADVFALGAVLYECLSGEPAFNGDTYVELLVQIASASHVALRKHGDYPSWLVSIVEGCLSAKPSARPAEGSALAAALEEGPRQRSGGHWARGLLAGALLLGLGGGAAWALQASTPPPSSTPAPTPEASTGASPEITPSPSPTPAPPGHPLRSYPASWSAFLKTPHTRLSAAWRPPDVSYAASLVIGTEGVMAIGERGLYALGEGPPVELLGGLPGLRRATTISEKGDLFVLVEEKRLRVLTIESGAPRSDLALERSPAPLATLAFGGVSVVLAHGKQLSTYPTIPNGRSQATPKFATLLAQPRVLAATRKEVLAGHGSQVTFLNVLGRVNLLRDFQAPVVALAYRRGEAPEALVGTRDGKLHCHDAQRALRGVVETGLAPLQDLATGQRLAALVGEKGLAIVDLESLAVIDRLDLSGLGIEVCSVTIGPNEETLAVGTEDGLVLRFELTKPGSRPVADVKARAAWGDTSGRHAKTISQVAATERHLVSADGTGAFHIWDPETGEGRTIRAAKRMPRFVLGKTGRLWVIEPNRVREFDADTGHELRRLPLSFLALEGALRQDEAELAFVGLRGDVEVWDLRTGASRFKTQLGGKDLPQQIALLPDGRVLLGYSSGLLALLQSDGSPGWTQTAGPKAVADLQLLSDGQRALVSCMDGSVTLWDLTSGEETLRFKTRPANSTSVAGDRILLGLSTGELELWTTSGERLWSQPGGVGIQPVVALRSPTEALVGGTELRVRRLQISDEAAGLRDLWAAKPKPEALLTLGFGAGPAPELTTVGTHYARTFEATSGRELRSHELGSTLRAAWGRSNLVTIGLGGSGPKGRTLGLDAWSLEEGEEFMPKRITSPAPNSFVLSANGKVAAYSKNEKGKNGVEVVLVSGGVKRFLRTGKPMNLKLSPTGNYLAAAVGAELQIWAPASSRNLHNLRLVAALLTFMPSSPQRLVQGELYGRIRIIDVVSGKEVTTFTPRYRRRPLLLEPGPQGRLLALAFQDGSLELWRVPEGERAARLRLPDAGDPPQALAFSPSGEQLAAATGRGRIVVFDLPR